MSIAVLSFASSHLRSLLSGLCLEAEKAPFFCTSQADWIRIVPSKTEKFGKIMVFFLGFNVQKNLGANEMLTYFNHDKWKIARFENVVFRK
jgi:hypothetical protein